MGYIFDPSTLHDIAKRAVGLKTRDDMVRAVSEELKQRYPKHITLDVPWLFNNAGGAMGQMKLLHCSLSEYILIFGTPIGTEGHSGRYTTEVYDFMLDGEMWCFHAGEFERAVYKPGDAAYLGADRAKGYAVPSHALMLEYARGPIPSMLPFGLADTVFSTLDRRTVGSTLFHYGKLVVRELLQGKICEQHRGTRHGRLGVETAGMPKSSTSLETFVSPEEFRAVVTALEKYPEFLPEVKRVVVKERTTDGALATFFVEVAVGGMEVKTEYTVRYTFGASEIRWQLVESPTLTKNEGFWRIEETKDGETKAQYESELVTTLAIPEPMQKIFADQELPKMMQRFRDRAEG